jgi:hypothetical protein
LRVVKGLVSLVALAVTAAALTTATPARAAFRWGAADPSCPSAAEVEAAVARAAGEEVHQPAADDAGAPLDEVGHHR